MAVYYLRANLSAALFRGLCFAVVSDLATQVYSFGVTLWEILSRKRPHEGLDHFEIQTAWIMHPLDMQLPPVKIDQSLTPQAAKIMATLSELSIDCTQIDPRQRPSFKEIVARIKMAGATESNV